MININHQVSKKNIGSTTRVCFFSFKWRQILCRFEPTKSTKGASKMRRDLINAEISNLRDLLPLPPSTRQRLSQLQLMALVCVYVRKINYFQQGKQELTYKFIYIFLILLLFKLYCTHYQNFTSTFSWPCKNFSQQFLMLQIFV